MCRDCAPRLWSQLYCRANEIPRAITAKMGETRLSKTENYVNGKSDWEWVVESSVGYGVRIIGTKLAGDSAQRARDPEVETTT